METGSVLLRSGDDVKKANTDVSVRLNTSTATRGGTSNEFSRHPTRSQSQLLPIRGPPKFSRHTEIFDRSSGACRVQSIA